MGTLDNRVAIITGAARGLGEGIARRFADEGAVVVIADRLDASELAASLPASPDGRAASAGALDVTNSDEVDAFINNVVATHGRLDIMVNNAGIFEMADMVDATNESYERIFGINVFGVFACSRAAGRVMKDQGSGRIISISSQLGRIARSSFGMYSASKAAVIMLMQALALELGPHGVTANSICPGSMVTGMLTTADNKPGIEYAAELGVDINTAFADYIDGRIPAGRLGMPSDVGAMATFLASDDAAFVTGAALNLTGGEQIFF